MQPSPRNGQALGRVRVPQLCQRRGRQVQSSDSDIGTQAHTSVEPRGGATSFGDEVYQIGRTLFKKQNTQLGKRPGKSPGKKPRGFYFMVYLPLIKQREHFRDEAKLSG